MHKLFIQRYTNTLISEINLKSNKNNDEIIFYINNTINNLPYHFKIGINIVGFLTFLFLKIGIFKFRNFLFFFSRVILFNKYILFIKTLILISINDD